MWRLLLTAVATLQARAHMNLFITEDEAFRLLGINAELYYVNQGVVNDYALNFVVMIPANIEDMIFSWQSLLPYPLPYVIAIYYGDEADALRPPEMNISTVGFIPTSVESFGIRLMCTGERNAEIDVEIHLNVTADDEANTTLVKLQRNKICLKGIRNDTILLDTDDSGISNNTIIYIAVGCAFAIFTVVVVVSTIFIKRKTRPNDSIYMASVYDTNPQIMLHTTVQRQASPESGSYATIASFGRGTASPSPYATTEAAQLYSSNDAFRVSYYAASQVMSISQICLYDSRLVNPTRRLCSLSVPREAIALEYVFEEGIFSKIYKGTYKRRPVTIKTTKEMASKRLVGRFLSEGSMMYGIEHKNVLTIICANLDDPKQPLLVFPFCNRGNLKRFLVKCRLNKDDASPTTQNLVDMAIQILLGLMYLHNQHICYKDVAVRNVVVDDKFHVKIIDNSLARDMFPNDYFCLSNQESRPIKWMALESLIYSHYSVASDVWSFGVVLWELMTMALQPYSEVDPYEMSTHLRTGNRLIQPPGCPDELFAVMTYCWVNCPSERPHLSQLLVYLREFYTALCRFV